MAPPTRRAAAAAAAGARPGTVPAGAPPLPVTLLSGFLGAGKTTLLRHILSERDPKMRCAVIVNDMAELNIDAAMVRGWGGAGAKAAAAGGAAAPLAPARLVELQNGCICCTLRDDLLQEVATLAAAGRFDYLVIESTGVSEPMQVAEAFTLPLGVEVGGGGGSGDEDGPGGNRGGNGDKGRGGPAPPASVPRALRDVARLDTCVTVVDAAQLRDNLASLQSVRERDAAARRRAQEAAAAAEAEGTKEKPEANDDADQGDADRGDDDQEDDDEDDPEGERHVTDLLVDQIEFADVLVLNKADLLPPSELPALRATLRALNREARIVETTHGRVPLEEVVATGRFCLERASQAAGWLADMQPGAKPHTPETEEYGIGSLVYRARRPFHPGRLHAWLRAHFVLQQQDWTDALHGEGGGEGGEGAGGRPGAAVTRAAAARAAANALPPEREAGERLARMRAAYGDLMRSKGFAWIAGRDDHTAEWSQAGRVLRLGTTGPWFDVLPREQWPEDAERVAAIERDFEPAPIGDRRQELVFIGAGVDRAALCAALDACLVTERERRAYQAAIAACDGDGGGEAEAAARALGCEADPLLPWPDVAYLLQEGGDEEEEEEEEEGKGGAEDDDDDDDDRAQEMDQD